MPVLSFPLQLADFWASLKILNFDVLRLGGGLQSQNTGDGEVIQSRTGQRLWEGDVALVAGPDHAATEALLTALQDPGRSFMIEAHDRPFPLRDPNGALLGASAPIIATLPAGGRSMTVSGLPAGYVLSPGDYISFTRGSPVRHELIKVVTGAVANGSGVTPEFEVSPGIRPGTTVSTALRLARPQFRAMIVPGSVRFAPVGPARGPRPGPSFGFRQTLTRAAT
ncbi:MAG: hypothetical protein JNK34_05745 [Tabrizicola sp.]|nr:hypothetical protein [Tabrizicola sp.]